MSVRPSARMRFLRLQIARDLAIVHRREVRCWSRAADLESKAHRRLRPFGIGGERYACAPEVAVSAVEGVR